MARECDYLINEECDPYVTMEVDGRKAMDKTNTRDNTAEFNVDKVTTTPKMKRDSSIIKIDVWDDDSGQWVGDEKPQIIVSTSGNVESFMKEPTRKSTDNQRQSFDSSNTINVLRPNYIEVDVRWTDARSEK